jgi:branched chain amino acid efflux pump
VTSTFSDGRALVLDVRAAGVAVGVLLLLVRVPLFVALVAAAGVVAAIRFAGVG